MLGLDLVPGHGGVEAKVLRDRDEQLLVEVYEPVSAESHEFRSLLNLLDTGRCWVKLSAPYETSKTGAPQYEDVSRLARALVKKAPERMLWASNWPHPSVPKEQRPSDEDLLELVLEWAADETTRRRILVDNPAELYGFK